MIHILQPEFLGVGDMRITDHYDHRTGVAGVV